MTDLVKALNNLHSLRNAVNQMGLAKAEVALEKFQRAIEDVREAQAELIAQQKEREELIKKYREELKEKGISLTDLGLPEVEKKVRKARTPMAPKYKFIDEQGQEKFWTGQGRMPRALQAALNQGKTLDAFKI